MKLQCDRLSIMVKTTALNKILLCCAIWAWALLASNIVLRHVEAFPILPAKSGSRQNTYSSPRQQQLVLDQKEGSDERLTPLRPSPSKATEESLVTSPFSSLSSSSPSPERQTKDRRYVLARAINTFLVGLPFPLLLCPPSIAQAVYVTDPHEPPTVPTADNISSFVQGTVTVPPGFDMETIVQQMMNNKDDPRVSISDAQRGSAPALYITCRPDRPDNVPKALLDGSRGKPPPVLSARYERPMFPFSFQLTDKDYTLEGMPANNSDENPWWIQENLIVSARLDMDGISATRSPEDLVGRAIYRSKKSGNVVEIDLTGRGAFGKFATKKK